MHAWATVAMRDPRSSIQRPPMLLDVEEMKCTCSGTAEKAIAAIDPQARITIDRAERRIRIEGAVSEHEAIAALASVGLSASRAAPHSGAGSDCCGGCS